ncbi:MAG: antitoxin [Cardiobacteriaceae bacterium]|nr:antitoxin [Cardiobacteriaceae bacterium]
MTEATVSKSQQEQTVHLPKDVAFPENVKKVQVIVLGKARLLTPDIWEDWFAQLPLADFPR